MNSIPFSNNPNDLLHELNQLNCAIGSSENLLGTLKSRRDAIERIVDEITRPSVQQARPPRRPIFRGFEYSGKYTSASTYIDLHLGVLRKVWADFPEKRDAIAQAFGRIGYSRRYIAKDRSELFEGKSAWWIQQHSIEFCEGWYADTNINLERIRRLLPIAVRVAGLKWGTDFVIYWNPTFVTVNPAKRNEETVGSE